VFLPGDRRYLHYISGSDANTGGIYLGALDTAERTRLVGDASSPGYAMDPAGEGYLLFVRLSTLLAQRLDAERGALTGEAFTVSEQVGSEVRLRSEPIFGSPRRTSDLCLGRRRCLPVDLGGPSGGGTRNRRGAGRGPPATSSFA